MTKVEFICSIIVMIFSLIVATAILSERVSERKMDLRKVKTIISLFLSVYSSIGLGFLPEYYFSADFKPLEVLTLSFSIFFIHFVISITIGFYKKRKDEEKMLKRNFIKDSKFIEEVLLKENEEDFMENKNNCYKKIVKIEDVRKYKRNKEKSIIKKPSR